VFLDLSFRFDGWWSALPKSPRDSGRVERLVIRPRHGAPAERETPDTIELKPGEGILGDRWIDDEAGSEGTQVSLINIHVLRSLATDEDQGLLSGDNLQVDLDLTEANLPIGSQLEIGSAILEVSDAIHRPCDRFVERFSAGAAKKVARAGRKARRGRGVLCTIAKGGSIRVGDEIRVVRFDSSDDNRPALLVAGATGMEVDLARTLLAEQGIPCMSRGPDFDVAELGTSVHNMLRGQNLYVPATTLERAKAILAEAWGNDRPGDGE